MFGSEAARRDFMMKDLAKKVVVYNARHYADLIQLPIKYLDHLHEAPALIEIQDKKLTASIAGNAMHHPTFEMLSSPKLKQAKKLNSTLMPNLLKIINHKMWLHILKVKINLRSLL